jgi:TusA-related sulfurtransferase
MHLLEPGDKLKCMKKGQILEVLTDYDGALDDIPAWCEQNGQKFIGLEEDEDCYKLYIKKKNKGVWYDCGLYGSRFGNAGKERGA